MLKAASHTLPTEKFACLARKLTWNMTQQKSSQKTEQKPLKQSYWFFFGLQVMFI